MEKLFNIIVDDKESISKSFKRLFRKEKIEVMTSNSGFAELDGCIKRK